MTTPPLPERNPDGTITIPATVTTEDGGHGDGQTTIGPDDPAFAMWDDWLSQQPAG